MSDVLFVSTLNVCRSPMAEIILQDCAKKRNLDIRVSSRGINVIIPSRAAPDAVKVMKMDYGLDLSGHVARQLAIEDVRAASVIYTMSDQHKNYLLASYPLYKDKVFLLAEQFGSRLSSIESLQGEDIFAYKACAKFIKECIEGLGY